MKDTRFPFRFFFLFAAFYSCQAFYGPYLNLFLSEKGFNNTQIGLTVSLSTLALLVAQPFWGLVSDKARYKNTILIILILGSIFISYLFPRVHGHWILVLMVTLNAVFYYPIMPLSDNLALEYLNNKKWNFGQVRAGGTLGFSLTVIAAGFLINDQYTRIFYYVIFTLLITLVISFTLPRVHGHRRGLDRAPIKMIFKNQTLVCLLFYYLAFSLGTSLFFSFYPIYYISIGGKSSFIGIMLFFTAMSELPFFFFADKLIKKFGVYPMILAAGVFTSIRWFLFYVSANPVFILSASLLHGVGFVTISYTIATHINTNVPKELRATGQTMVALILAFFSRILFGYIGGILCDRFGVVPMLLAASIMTIAATIIFAVWFPRIKPDNGFAE